jgi:SAM-dependent methyltransferase
MDAKPSAGHDVPAELLADFNQFLHELRTRALRTMPPGGRTLLSGGCSGRWYFDWIRDNYPGVERHIGVEAYSEPPPDLPPEVTWYSDYLGNLQSVGSAAVDLVFAGQTVEHLWPDDLANFLAEAHRVLRPGGAIVLDSPNRTATTGLGWYQPQHTAELTTEEIVELLRLAGFEEITVKGIWLCYDRENHRFLPLDPAVAAPGWDLGRRLAESARRPEDCFVWWAEARCGPRAPDRGRLRARTRAIYDRAFTQALGRSFQSVGRTDGWADNRFVTTNVGEGGYALYGPYVPLQPGRYVARFAIALRQPPPGCRPRNAVVCVLDVTSDMGRRVLAQREVRGKDLTAGRVIEIPLQFTARETEFGTEFRARCTGAAPLALHFPVQLVEVDRMEAILRAA